jgi:hypothetical protein
VLAAEQRVFRLEALNGVMATISETATSEGQALVDPRAPRFGQTITSTLLLAGIAFARPQFVYLVAALLVTAVASGWRVDAYARLWRSLLPVVGGPEEREPAAPHRFAKLLGAVGTALASGLLLAGLRTPGFAVAALVATAAGLAAATGICLGCRLYRQVGVARDLGVL